MNAIPLTTTLADLAVTHSAASRVFHGHGLDFCCHGRRPLAEACAERGLDPAAVLAQIEADSQGLSSPRWDFKPLSDVVDHIVTHYHRRLRLELPELVAMAAKVEMRHAEKESCPRGLCDHLRKVHEEVLEHLEKEEGVLFPMIQAGQGRMSGGPIHVMELEHDDHRRNLERIRELTTNLNPPEEACTTWRALYLRLSAFEAELMEHIHLENHVLFPRALQS
jgi:regulator of cell morphogenesis and NO signaling